MTNLKMTRTVFKLGGSLLDQANWPARLTAWLERQPPGEYFGIVGGGELIEAMRRMDELYRLSPREMHWRCIRLLDATFEIAGELLCDFTKVISNEHFGRLRTERPSQLTGNDRTGFWVRVGAFYTATPDASNIPAEDWGTTTDTLAIWLGGLLAADRCVLLKSCDVEAVESLEEAAARGIVDRECVRFRELVPRVELHKL